MIPLGELGSSPAMHSSGRLGSELGKGWAKRIGRAWHVAKSWAKATAAMAEFAFVEGWGCSRGMPWALLLAAAFLPRPRRHCSERLCQLDGEAFLTGLGAFFALYLVQGLQRGRAGLCQLHPGLRGTPSAGARAPTYRQVPRDGSKVFLAMEPGIAAGAHPLIGQEQPGGDSGRCSFPCAVCSAGAREAILVLKEPGVMLAS